MARVARGIHQVHIHTDWQDVPVMMDAAAAARVLGCTYQSVVKALQQERLPGQKVMGGWRIRKDALMAHLGYAQWEIERYGYGMNTAPGEDGRGPVVTDGFKRALRRKEELTPSADGYTSSTACGGPPSSSPEAAPFLSAEPTFSPADGGNRPQGEGEVGSMATAILEGKALAVEGVVA